MLNAIADLEGRPFPSLLRMVMEFLEGQLHIRSSGPDLYCAALVAVMYQRMGLLPAEDPPPNWYDPKRFSEEFEKLPMLHGKLGHTYYVDLASS